MFTCVCVFYFILETQQLVLIQIKNLRSNKIQYNNFKYFVVAIVVVVTFSLLLAFKNTKEKKIKSEKEKKTERTNKQTTITTEPDSKII